MTQSPILLWLRRDLRLSDHPALHAACATGRPVIPVFILDPETERLGAAPKWRLGLAVERFAQTLIGQGAHLILRRGAALDVLRALMAETGATAVWWSRLYDPQSIARDSTVKAALKADGADARTFGGHVMFEPWTVQTGQGGFYKVYSPMWRAVRDRPVDAPLPRPARIPAPEEWPVSDDLNDWQMGAAMRRGAAVMLPHQRVGEEAARDRLDQFIDRAVAGYKARRDFPAEDACSGMSENLTYGEISPHQIWHAGQRAMEQGAAGAEHFLKELVWREFAYHLIYHTPEITERSWRPEWQGFPWTTDRNRPEIVAWQQAQTGVPIVDAGLREMYVTGKMHNRVRMIVASYLTKHLLGHWRIGMDWFADCLTDWDPASNAMGWQWVAGCGPDAAPYFRVFNPATQATKFDPDGQYLRRWLPKGSTPSTDALSYFYAVPRSWGLRPDVPYPQPSITLDAGRKAALTAYEAFRENASNASALA
ncbi:MAG: deoxyribodipyrimidine photo-lyase [Paracoccaceae bacterium]